MPRYYQVEDEENLELIRLIDEEFLRYPFYGSRKMMVYLNRKGIPVNRKRIQRLIRLMGLESIAPKPNTSRQRKGHKVYPYLLKKISITQELLSGLKEYFEFYNFERPHQSLVGKTPAEIYWGREVARKAA